MCKRCDDLKIKIDRCRRLINQTPDDLTVQRLGEMLANYEMQLQIVDCTDKK